MKGCWFILGVTLFIKDAVSTNSTTPPTLNKTSVIHKNKSGEVNTTIRDPPLALNPAKIGDKLKLNEEVGSRPIVHGKDGYIESSKCPGVQCFKPNGFEKSSNCTPEYRNGTVGGGPDRVDTCCPVWVCEGKNGNVSTFSSYTASAANLVGNKDPPQKNGGGQGQMGGGAQGGQQSPHYEYQNMKSDSTNIKVNPNGLEQAEESSYTYSNSFGTTNGQPLPLPQQTKQ